MKYHKAFRCQQIESYILSQTLLVGHNEITQQDIIMCMSFSRFLFYTINACFNLNQKWTQNFMLTRNLKNNNTNSDNNNDNVEGEIEKALAHNIFTFLLLIVVSVLTYDYLGETSLSYFWNQTLHLYYIQPASCFGLSRIGAVGRNMAIISKTNN